MKNDDKKEGGKHTGCPRLTAWQASIFCSGSQLSAANRQYGPPCCPHGPFFAHLFFDCLAEPVRDLLHPARAAPSSCSTHFWPISFSEWSFYPV